MKTHRLPILIALAVSVGMLNCGDDDDDGSGPATGAAGSTSSGTGGSSSAGTGGKASTGSGGSTGSGSLGPKCTAYYACCDELAAANPTLGSACEQSEKASQDSLKQNPNGASQLEAACAQALTAVQSAGYCK